jgi:Domain of unknown function (DUF2017)
VASLGRRRKQILPFHPNGDGTFTIGLALEDREFLGDLPRQMKALIESDDEASTRRLFPPAYHREADGEREEEYRRYMREEILISKTAAMEMIREKVDGETLTTEEMMAWMSAINDIRLVLGTQLDVYEGFDIDDLDADDPRLPGMAAYGWLSGLLELIVARLSGADADDPFADRVTPAEAGFTDGYEDGDIDLEDL